MIEREDPRWLHAWLSSRAAKTARDEQKQLDGIVNWLRTIEEIAADPEALAEDRDFAQDILEQIRISCRAMLPQNIRALTRLAETAPEEEIRYEASELLRKVTAQLPAASDTVQ